MMSDENRSKELESELLDRIAELEKVEEQCAKKDREIAELRKDNWRLTELRIPASELQQRARNHILELERDLQIARAALKEIKWNSHWQLFAGQSEIARKALEQIGE